MIKRYFMHDGFIIANELLTLSEKTGKTQINLETHRKFIKKLESYMKDKFNIDFIDLPHENGFKEWSKEHGDYFELFEKYDHWFVKLKNDVRLSDLRKHFRSILPYEALKAFIDNEQNLIELVSQRKKNFSQTKENFVNTYSSIKEIENQIDEMSK